MSTIAACRPGLLAVVAALVGAAVLLPPGAAFVAPAIEVADPAAVAAEDQEEPDSPELDEERLLDLVADAQRLLQLSGYDPGPIDGRLGLRTQRAIRAYQAAARRSGTLEALKGPAREGSAPRPELVGVEPELTR